MANHCAVKGSGISFSYEINGQRIVALDNVDIEIKKGEITAILGANGCGKSTLVKHFNALLPSEFNRSSDGAGSGGIITVAGIDANDKNEIWKIRRLCGMVFQNPDNQFVSSIIEEDIAFGLENYEVPRSEIPRKVKDALSLVGMAGHEKRSPHSLSGGQKQRIALAGVLALEPEIIIFDEVTSMLDPEGRREILSVIRDLSKTRGKTVIMITHYVDEAVFADTVYLMKSGRITAGGTPREILSNTAMMADANLIPPIPVRMYHDLIAAGIEFQTCPLTNEELAEEICRLS